MEKIFSGIFEVVLLRVRFVIMCLINGFILNLCFENFVVIRIDLFVLYMVFGFKGRKFRMKFLFGVMEYIYFSVVIGDLDCIVFVN